MALEAKRSDVEGNAVPLGRKAILKQVTATKPMGTVVFGDTDEFHHLTLVDGDSWIYGGMDYATSLNKRRITDDMRPVLGKDPWDFGGARTRVGSPTVEPMPEEPTVPRATGKPREG